MISVPCGTGDICLANDIRFADDIRLQRIIRNGYHIILPLRGKISYLQSKYIISRQRYISRRRSIQAFLPYRKAASFFHCPSTAKPLIYLGFGGFSMEIGGHFPLRPLMGACPLRPRSPDFGSPGSLALLASDRNDQQRFQSDPNTNKSAASVGQDPIQSRACGLLCYFVC